MACEPVASVHRQKREALETSLEESTDMPHQVSTPTETEAAEAAEAAEYIDRLTAHDWEFEHSDDQGVWRRGRDELAWLRKEQKRIDLQGKLWNILAPVSHQLPLEDQSSNKS